MVAKISFGSSLYGALAYNGEKINKEEGDDDPELDYNLNFTFNKAQKREVRAALSNTFGFGGHNCCVVFKKYAE